MHIRPQALAASLLVAMVMAQHAQAQTTTALPEVKVSDGADSAATEGSGQYTAREVSVGKLVQSPRETPQSMSEIGRAHV